MRKICFLLSLCLLLPISASAAEAPRYIALTFDGGPWGEETRLLLEGLDSRGVKATFFLSGSRAEQHPDLAERIWQAGHEIGIQGHSHRDAVPMSRREIAAEITAARGLLPEKCRVRLLRPGDSCSDGVNQVAGALGLAVIDWSVDTRDRSARDTAAVGRTLSDRVKDGDIILMHHMSASSVSAALNIVDILKSRGFTFVTVSELARLHNVRLQPGKHYRRFPDESTGA